MTDHERLEMLKSQYAQMRQQLTEGKMVISSIAPNDFKWFIDSIEELQAEKETLSMAHDQSQRRIKQLERELIITQDNSHRDNKQSTKNAIELGKKIDRLQTGNLRLREVIRELNYIIGEAIETIDNNEDVNGLEYAIKISCEALEGSL